MVGNSKLETNQSLLRPDHSISMYTFYMNYNRIKQFTIIIKIILLRPGHDEPRQAKRLLE